MNSFSLASDSAVCRGSQAEDRNQSLSTSASDAGLAPTSTREPLVRSPNFLAKSGLSFDTKAS